MIMADVESKQFLMVNKAICRMLGYTEEELKDLGVKDIHPDEELAHVIDIFASQAKGNLKLATDMIIKKKDGTVFYADIATSLIYLKGKKYLVGSFRDTTKRKAAEAALQISEANYRSIFELATDAIMIRDMKTYKTIEANRAACEMFGYSKEEIEGLYIKDFMADEFLYRWEDARHFYEKAALGEPQTFEWQGVTKSGNIFWVEAKVKRAIIGDRYRLISIIRDITERKNLMAMKDSFVNSVSHELRTPLAAIREGIALVFDGIEEKIGGKNKKILGIVKRNVDRLNRLIDNVLDFQKIESGITIFNPRQYCVKDVVAECYKTMLPLANEKDIKLSMYFAKDIPRIFFDKDKILQVFMNLVNNAIKFTEKGSVRISAKVNGNAVKIAISDTGAGIRHEDIPKVFQKFWRGESGQKVRTPGTGLGLAISKEIIEKHGGKIWVESEFGKGTTFCFLLPVKERRG